MSTQTRGTVPSSEAMGQITLRELVRDRTFLLCLMGQATSGAGSAPSRISLVAVCMLVVARTSVCGLGSGRRA